MEKKRAEVAWETRKQNKEKHESYKKRTEWIKDNAKFLKPTLACAHTRSIGQPDWLLR